jgi:hypothetical protein
MPFNLSLSVKDFKEFEDNLEFLTAELILNRSLLPTMRKISNTSVFGFLIEYCASRERELNLLLESSELTRIRDEYKKKIEEIEHDYHEALAPVIGRMQVSHLSVLSLN